MSYYERIREVQNDQKAAARRRKATQYGLTVTKRNAAWKVYREAAQARKAWKNSAYGRSVEAAWKEMKDV